MRGKYLRKFGALIFTFLVLPGVVALSSSTTAEAQRRGRVIIVHRPIYRPWGWGYRGWGYGGWGYGGWDYRGWGYSPYFDYYSRFGHYVFDDSDAAFNQGYKDGLKTGQGDAKHDRTYNPQRSHYYKEAGFGNFGEVFRSGFLRGYEEGFRS